MTSLSDFAANRLLGGPEPLSAYAGRLVLIVNVASKCGSTPQYGGLQKLWEDFGARGLTVLGFPCNQFDAQEPGTESEIAAFCDLNYGVSFPLFRKIEVNGPGADPLYKWLKAETPGSDNREIEWNFIKFLIGRDGNPIKRYREKDEPAAIALEIERLL